MICLVISLSRFGTALTFASLTTDDIDIVTNFARTKLKKRLEQQDAMKAEILQNFYGGFYSPEEFEIQPGDLNLIFDTLVPYVRKKINYPEGNKVGFKHFKKGKNARSCKDLMDTPFGRFFGNVTQKQKIKRQLNIEDTEQGFSAKNDCMLIDLLYKKLRKDLEKLGYGDDIIEKFDDKAVVDTSKAGTINGYITCVFCCVENDSSKKGTIAVYFDDTYWVLSNFVTHLKRCHAIPEVVSLTTNSKILVKQDRKRKKKVTSERPTVVTSTPNEKSSQQTIKINSIEFLDVDVVDKNDDEAEWETLNEEEEAISPEVMKREESFVFSQISIQESKMNGVVLANNEELKTVSITSANERTTNVVETCDMEADGNCLFAAIAHQLFLEKIGSKQHKASTKQLRVAAVDYIKQHLTEFEHVLRSEESKKVNTVKSRNAQLNRLAKNGTWGGSESILAISRTYAINIIIFIEDGHCYLIDDFNFNYGKCILIAYTKYGRGSKLNHYESICKINRDIIFHSMKHLMRVIKQKENNDVIELD